MIACAKWLGRTPQTCTRGAGCVCMTEGAKRYRAVATQEIGELLNLHQLVAFDDGTSGHVDMEQRDIHPGGREQFRWTVRIEAKDGWRSLWHERTIN